MEHYNPAPPPMPEHRDIHADRDVLGDMLPGMSDHSNRGINGVLQSA